MYRIIGIISLAVLLMISSVMADDFFGLFKRGERGSGDLKTVELDLDSFNRIETHNSSDFIIHIGEAQKVLLTFDDNLLDNIVTKVRGKTLKVDTDESYSSHNNCKFEITIPSLEYISISGSSDFEIKEYKGKMFTCKITGSGDITIDGEVKKLKIRINGSGDFDGRELISEDVRIKISGSGDANIFASESFDGSISGSGDITVYGDPEYFDRSTSGSGSIRRR